MNLRVTNPIGVAGRRLAIAVAVATLAGLPVSAAGSRLLLDAGDAQVSQPNEAPCGSAVELRVTGQDPRLFSGDSQRLQALVDTARALLAYECAYIPEVRVSGQLAGLGSRGDAPFHGIATASGEWRVAADRTLEVGGLEPPRAPERRTRPAARDEQPVAQAFSVTSLHAGMGLDEARAVIRSEYGVEPRWDPYERRLVVETGGCDVRFDAVSRPGAARPGWRCLEASFTEHRRPQLHRLHYLQVVDGRRARPTTRALVERYGAPATRTVARAPDNGADQGRSIQLGWGDVVDGARRTLEARVTADGEVTVVQLTLSRPDLQVAKGSPRYDVKF